ncbi:MAG: hypothetical protein KDD78_12610, partial [Caldilineaceae bacterium]|nr:hypothetical protein [Caldilineaceae bacterium]
MSARRKIGILVVFMILLLTAACGAPSAAPATDTEAQAAAEDAPAADAAAGDAAEIVIQHWYHQYGEEGTFEAA